MFCLTLTLTLTLTPWVRPYPGDLTSDECRAKGIEDEVLGPSQPDPRVRLSFQPRLPQIFWPSGSKDTLKNLFQKKIYLASPTPPPPHPSPPHSLAPPPLFSPPFRPPNALPSPPPPSLKHSKFLVDPKRPKKICFA